MYPILRTLAEVALGFPSLISSLVLKDSKASHLHFSASTEYSFDIVLN